MCFLAEHAAALPVPTCSCIEYKQVSQVYRDPCNPKINRTSIYSNTCTTSKQFNEYEQTSSTKIGPESSVRADIGTRNGNILRGNLQPTVKVHPTSHTTYSNLANAKRVTHPQIHKFTLSEPRFSQTNMEPNMALTNMGPC